MPKIPESLKKRHSQWVEVVNAGNIEAYGDLLADNAVWIPPGQDPIAGKEAFKQWLTPFMRRFAYDFSITEEQMMVSGDWAFERGSTGWHIHPDITITDQDIVIQKTTPDSFYCTKLHAEFESRSIGKLVMAGIQTEFCIDTTCRRAFSLGYDVTVAGDAHGTWDKDDLTAPQITSHHNQILREWFAEVKEVSKIDFNR